jgi:PST family polysaccharide transporter
VRHGAAFALNAVGGILLARLLGPTILGLYFAAAIAYAIGRQLVDFGVTPNLIRKPAAEVDFAAACWLQRGLGLGLVVLALAAVALGVPQFVSPVHGRTLGPLLAAAALGAAANAWQAPAGARLERRLDYARLGRIEVLEPLAFNAVAVGLALAGLGIWALATALVVRGALPAVFAWRAARLGRQRFPDRAAVRALVTDQAPLVASQLTLWAILAAPAVVLGRLRGPEELGYAQMAYGLLGNAGIPAVVFQRVAFASLSRLQDDPERFARAVRRSLALLAALYVPLLFGAASFATLWVPRLCGERWTPMAPVVLAGALPVTLAGMLGILYAAVLAHGEMRLVLRQNLLHAGVYWLALAVLSRPLGALAMPAAHLLALPAAILYLRAHARRHGAAGLAAPLGGVAAGAAVGGAAAWLVANGRTGLAIALWVVTLAIIGPWIWKRLGLAALVRELGGGARLEVPGL